MSEKKNASAIRLSSRTAIALRRSAERVRLICAALGVVVTFAMFALAVFLGLRWLPAIPITVAFAVFADLLIWVHAQRVSLSMTSLALSAEQASRALRADSAEKRRKEEAEADREEIRRDLRRRADRLRPSPGTDAPGSGEGSGKETNEPEGKTEEEPGKPEEGAPRRRRSRARFSVIEGNRKG